jgi:hypothetical protein
MTGPADIPNMSRAELVAYAKRFCLGYPAWIAIQSTEELRERCLEDAEDREYYAREMEASGDY